MENFGWKGLGLTLYQRVLLSWKSSLIGFGIAIGDAALTYTDTVKLPTWAHVILGIVSMAFLLLKQRYPTQPPIPPLALLTLLLPLTLPIGCSGAKLSPSEQAAGAAALQCGVPAMIQAAKDAWPAVVDALAGPTPDWPAVVDRLRVTGGAAVICAMRTYVAQMDAGAAVAPAAWQASYLVGASREDPIRYQRAKAYLAKNGF